MKKIDLIGPAPPPFIDDLEKMLRSRIIDEKKLSKDQKELLITSLQSAKKLIFKLSGILTILTGTLTRPSVNLSTLPTIDYVFEAHFVHHDNGAIINKIPFMKKTRIGLVFGGGAMYIKEYNWQHYELLAGLERNFKIFKRR